MILNPKVFIVLLFASCLCYLFFLRIVHRCDMNLVSFGWLIQKIGGMAFAYNILILRLISRCFGGKVNRGLIIVFVHLRNIEGDYFSWRASFLLNEACLVEIFGSFWQIIFIYLVNLWAHLVHVLRKGHSLFEACFYISFKIIIHFNLINILIPDKIKS